MSVAPGRRASRVALYGSLTGLSLLWLVPVATAFMISVLPLDRTHAGWWTFHLRELTWGNYVRAWHQGLSGYVVNSFVITLCAVALTVALGVLAAYAFARLKFRFERLAYFLLVTTMIVPVQIILIPLLPWFRTLGLTAGPRQYVGIVLVHTAFGAGWAIFMLTSFIAEIPNDFFEAAQVDGARHVDLFRRLVLPLALPGIVSFAIIDFIFVWNDLLLALTLLQQDYQPLTVGLANLQSPHLAQEDVVSAGAMMAILPPLALFTLLNRFYVRGLFAGGVKG